MFPTPNATFLTTTTLDAAATAAPIEGSQGVLFACAGALLLAMFAGARHGYWHGPVRQIAPTLALILSILGAWMGGAAFGHRVLHGTLVPWLLRGVCGMFLLGSILWLIVFAFLWRLGRNRCPNPTGETENPVLGAIVGCWTAILWSTVAFFLLAATGAIAQFWLDNTRPASDSITARVLTQLVVVKNSLARVNGAAWLKTWNPLPAHLQRTIEKGLRVLNTPGAILRLQRQEPIRAIATDPAFYPLTQNPEIRQFIAAHDIHKLLTHPAVLQLLADDNFQRKLAQTNLDQLLDQALEEKP